MKKTAPVAMPKAMAKGMSPKMPMPSTMAAYKLPTPTPAAKPKKGAVPPQFLKGAKK